MTAGVHSVEEIDSHHPWHGVVISVLFVRWLCLVREPRSERPKTAMPSGAVSRLKRKTAMQLQALLADSSVELESVGGDSSLHFSWSWVFAAW